MRRVFLVLLLTPLLTAYSVLTHEQVIDVAWDDEIQPLLLARFPGTTPENLKKAHAYAYGGSVIQDLGYYPFGSKLFSDLTHYVRTGDFVMALMKDANDVNEYAFALGALAHYVSDVHGHPAVNRAVALEFPKLRAKFGDSITYAQGHTEHLRTEFGFDVTQVAKERYTSDQYHSFIGFEVSKELLERVFPEVYGIPLKSVMPRESLAIGSYRRAVSGVIPEMTKVALQTNRVQFAPEKDDAAKRKFLYTLSRVDYERDWGKEYQRPGFGTKLLAFVLRIMPRVGPFKALKVQPPNAKTEDLYFKSINETLDVYKNDLRQMRSGPLTLDNMDLDTGKPAHPGEYALADKTLRELKKKQRKPSNRARS